jgi:hypothetical protein
MLNFVNFFLDFLFFIFVFCFLYTVDTGNILCLGMDVPVPVYSISVC